MTVRNDLSAAALAALTRELSREHLLPFAARRDRDGIFPHEAVKPLAEAGLFGICVPKKLGGLGLGARHLAAAVAEVASCDGGMALTVASHNTLALGHLLLAGDAAQQRRYLPAMARGEVLGAWALSEAQAGSDPTSLRTWAERDGDGWCLHGNKAFVTQGTVAGLYIVIARTAPQKGRAGLSAFLVEAGTPGVTAGNPLDKVGCRSSDTSSLLLRDVHLPATALLGACDQALSDILQLLDLGRVAIAAMALGLARAALQQATAYARKRRQFGREIGAFQGVQWMLADSATEIEASRLLIEQAADLIDRQQPATTAAAQAKLFAAEAATRVANRALQIHGGYGYLRTLSVERILRDAKLCELGEGTSEIQRLIIARNLLRGESE